MDASVTDKQLVELTERRHPEYNDMLEHWDFLEACYSGGRAWFEGNIFKYIKEGSEEYKERTERAYRFNHTREIVDLVNKYIFKASVTRNVKDANKSILSFWKESTRNKLPIDQYMRQISQAASTFGRVWIVVDNTGVDESDKTLKEEKESGARTYSYIVRPQDAVDMSYDEEGALNWILIREVARDDDDPFLSSGDERELFRLWTTEYWMLFERTEDGDKTSVEELDSGEHGLGIVPVIKCDHVESGGLYTAPALIGDIAYLDKAVANYSSNLDAIIQDQTFSQLVMPAQGIMPGEDGYDKLIEMGTKRIFTYDGEGGARPEFISPDPKQAELIIMVIKQLVNEIYHSVGMAGERTKSDNNAGIDNSSGVAKAFDFERVNALLTSKADSLDTAESGMINLVNLWNGEEPIEEDLVQYADSFDVRELADEFEITNQLTLVDAPETIRREQMRGLVEKLLPRISKDLKKQIESELKAWPKKDTEVMNSAGSLLKKASKSKQIADGRDEKDEKDGQATDQE